MTAEVLSRSPSVAHCRDTARHATRNSTAESVVGYARHPVDGRQLRALVSARRAAGCGQVFGDVAGGAASIRPGLETALSALTPGCILAVASLALLSWREDGLREILAAVERAGAHLVADAEGLDTQRESNIFELSRTFEAFAASVRASRLAEADASRPDSRFRIQDDEWAEVKPMLKSGALSVAQVATRLNVDRSTVYRRLEKRA